MNEKELGEILGKLNISIKNLERFLDKPEPHQKDWWDKFGLATKFIATVLLVTIGGIFTFVYNAAHDNEQQALETQRQQTYELDTLSKFMPYITHEDEEKREIAIFLVQELIGTKMATRLAVLNVNPETPKILKRLSELDQGEGREVADEALKMVVKSPDFSVVSTLYVTDRKALDSRPGKFSGKRGDVSYGTADVSIPLTHRLGALESPSVYRLEIAEDPTKHVTLLTSDTMDREQFNAAVGQYLSRSSADEILVFVHDFNVPFDFALKRLAQLSYDLNFQGVAILYSWPSAGSVYSYLADAENSAWTVNNLVSFLQEIRGVDAETKIHLLAQGMGGRSLVMALQELTNRLNMAEMPVFDQLILAAPDMDLDAFNMSAPELTNVAQRVTVYVSSEDQSLAVSANIHSGPRVGQAAEHIVTVPGIDVIDVSEADTSIVGHSYYSGSIAVMADLYQVLRGTASTERQNLSRVISKDAAYWKIP